VLKAETINVRIGGTSLKAAFSESFLRHTPTRLADGSSPYYFTGAPFDSAILNPLQRFAVEV
jgi:hypothetical protein